MSSELWREAVAHLRRSRLLDSACLPYSLDCDGVAYGDGVNGLGAEWCCKVVSRSTPTLSAICQRFPRLRGRSVRAVMR